MQMAEVQQLLFGKDGSINQLPWPAWQQGFFFSEQPGLQYGLVQIAGGPCGLLAAMQAGTPAASAVRHNAGWCIGIALL